MSTAMTPAESASRTWKEFEEPNRPIVQFEPAESEDDVGTSDQNSARETPSAADEFGGETMGFDAAVQTLVGGVGDPCQEEAFARYLASLEEDALKNEALEAKIVQFQVTLLGGVLSLVVAE
jgi:hypothetical protein